jgi:2-oxoglutarate ferredoxin oxidoreductase subunit delta
MPEVVQVTAQSPEVTDGAARPAARKGRRGRVVIFGTWCKGCGLCVEFCPADVLALNRDGHPFVAAPDKCTACHWCDTHCPDLAIVVTRIE